MTALKLRRLVNSDGEVVGYFSDHVAEKAARAAWWNPPEIEIKSQRCRSVETAIISAELEDVEPGDGDRTEYVYTTTAWSTVQTIPGIGHRTWEWFNRGAASVEIRRYLVNRYRRPGMSNRDADLGGPREAAGVLYVLVVKAPM